MTIIKKKIYEIADVKDHTGHRKPERIGRRVLIERLEQDHSAWLPYENSTQCLVTSPVLSFQEVATGDIFISTENSIYHLMPVRTEQEYL